MTRPPLDKPDDLTAATAQAAHVYPGGATGLAEQGTGLLREAYVRGYLRAAEDARTEARSQLSGTVSAEVLAEARHTHDEKQKKAFGDELVARLNEARGECRGRHVVRDRLTLHSVALRYTTDTTLEVAVCARCGVLFYPDGVLGKEGDT